MQQLECRFYSRQEIAEITSVNLKDSKHFAERVKTTLDKWGYEYNYSRSGVEITGKPELPGEKLSEILIRELNIDVQVDPFAFAYFICAFSDIPHFSSMPWEERSSAMRYKYEVEVSDRTLRNWCSKLIENGIIQKSGEKCFWKTEIMYGMKTRELLPKEKRVFEGRARDCGCRRSKRKRGQQDRLGLYLQYAMGEVPLLLLLVQRTCV